MEAGYKQFCPVALAAELLCRRWTIVILREFVAGSTRFNDLRRGLPAISPTLLAQRLRELEVAGILQRVRGEDDRGHLYQLTDAGRDLEGIVFAMGIWGQKWIDSDLQLTQLDPRLLMWDMRRNLDPSPLPSAHTVIQFVFPELTPAQRRWWLVVDKSGGVELCLTDPGTEIDLCVTTDLRTLTAIWMGRTTVRKESGRMSVAGDPRVAKHMQAWLGLSPFAVHATAEALPA